MAKKTGLNAYQALNTIYKFYKAVPEEFKREHRPLTQAAKKGIKDLALIFKQTRMCLEKLEGSYPEPSSRCQDPWTLIDAFERDIKAETKK